MSQQDDYPSGTRALTGVSGTLLALSEIENVKRYLENRHGIILPEIDVRYSDKITSAMAIPAVELPTWASSETRRMVIDHAKSLGRREGLKDDDLDEIDPSKFIVFLPRRCWNCPVERYENVWHELGHAAAHVIGLRDREYEESFAVTHSLLGLLLEAKAGKFSYEKCFTEIEHVIKRVQLSLPGFTPHRWSLNFVEKYNPHLRFRTRKPEELVGELNRTVEDIVNTDREIYEIVLKRTLDSHDVLFILPLGIVAAIFIILGLLSRFHIF